MSWYEKDHFKFLKGISDRLAARFDWATPNLVTLSGLALTAPMAWCFWHGHQTIGLLVFLASIATDWLDGALARYQHGRMSAEERTAQDGRFILLRRGQTDSKGLKWFEWPLSGVNLDPTVDKVRYFLALFTLAWHRLPHWLIWTGFGFAAALTVGRPLVIALFDLRLRANLLGKIKVYFELALVLALAALPPGPWSDLLCLALLAIATFGGAASAVTQARTATKAWLAARKG